MPRSSLLATLLGSAVFLGGCVHSSPPRPWFEGEQDWPSIARYEVEVGGKKVPLELAYQISCADGDALWIYLYLHDFSRRDSSVELRFAPQTAYIQKENGQRFVGHAEPYEKTSEPGASAHGAGAGQCKTHSGAAGKKLRLNQPVYLRFATAAPNADSRWTLNMGKVFVGSAEIPLPIKNIVLRKTQWSVQKMQ